MRLHSVQFTRRTLLCSAGEVFLLEEDDDDCDDDSTKCAPVGVGAEAMTPPIAADGVSFTAKSVIFN